MPRFHSWRYRNCAHSWTSDKDLSAEFHFCSTCQWPLQEVRCWNLQELKCFLADTNLSNSGLDLALEGLHRVENAQRLKAETCGQGCETTAVPRAPEIVWHPEARMNLRGRDAGTPKNAPAPFTLNPWRGWSGPRASLDKARLGSEILALLASGLATGNAPGFPQNHTRSVKHPSSASKAERGKNRMHLRIHTPQGLAESGVE